jgi:hypothetical protein
MLLRENNKCEELDPVPLCYVRPVIAGLQQIVEFGKSKKISESSPKKIKVEFQTFKSEESVAWCLERCNL